MSEIKRNMDSGEVTCMSEIIRQVRNEFEQKLAGGHIVTADEVINELRHRLGIHPDLALLKLFHEKHIRDTNELKRAYQDTATAFEAYKKKIENEKG